MLWSVQLVYEITKYLTLTFALVVRLNKYVFSDLESFVISCLSPISSF